jgi:hypothetical protein
VRGRSQTPPVLTPHRRASDGSISIGDWEKYNISPAFTQAIAIFCEPPSPTLFGRADQVAVDAKNKLIVEHPRTTHPELGEFPHGLLDFFTPGQALDMPRLYAVV